MKIRILSASVGIVILIIVMFFYKTIVFPIAVSIFLAGAIFELFKSTNLLKGNLPVFLTVLIASLIYPFLFYFKSLDPFILLTTLFILISFIFQLRNFEKISIFNYAFIILASIVIISGFTSLVYFRDLYSSLGFYYILLVFSISWVCDAGGYFVGSAIGKTKLASRISPNKTVEGAIGGVVLNIIFAMAYSYLMSSYLTVGLSINYLNLLIFVIAASCVGILGDLCSSVVKRELGIKDYGDLIPGHGGIIDRFDSFIFVSVFTFVFIKFLPIAV